MNRVFSMVAIAAVLTACAQPRPYQPSTYATPQRAALSASHTYEVTVVDKDSRPIQGAKVNFDSSESSPISCTTGPEGVCTYTFSINSATQSIPMFSSTAKYVVEMPGYYSSKGTSSSRYGSYASREPAVVKEKVSLYRAEDYLSPTLQGPMRQKALNLVTAIRLQSLIVDADITVGGIGVSDFKGKKYLSLKMIDTNVYNSIKLNKYQIGTKIFDDKVRKILNPLNDHFGDERALAGYDVNVTSAHRNFVEKYSIADRLEYRYILPKQQVAQYKDKDISGQKLIDASVILLSDERIDLKLE